jgi:hypothetical protein
VQFVQPPILITPTCSTTVNYSDVLSIVFSWIPPPAMINPALLNYDFRLIEVPQGMNAIQAMQSVSIPVAQENTIFNTFLYTTLNPPLIPGRLYAWRVKVSDLSNSILFSNNGESEICEFRYGLPSPIFTPLTAKIVYPAPNTKTPFKTTPVVAEFDPVDTKYRKLSSDIKIINPTGQQYNVDMYLDWPEGPDAYYQQKIGAPPTLDQIQNVLVSRPPDSNIEMPELNKGQNYRLYLT